MKREHQLLSRAVAGMAAISLLAGACSGETDDAEPDPSVSDTTSGDDEQHTDAEDVLADVDDGDPVDNSSDEEAAEENGDAEESANEAVSDADDLGATSPASERGDQSSDGSFDTEEGEAEGDFFDEGDDAEAEFVDDPPPVEPDDSFIGATFEDYGQRTFVDTDRDPLSTFSLDVDTGSYSVARAALNNSQLPPAASVRPEEFINAFDYNYDSPNRGLALNIDGAPSPFDRDSILVRVGVSSERVDERPPVALTFIVDTSGSMDQPNRLPLVRDSLEILVEELERTGDGNDTVAIVTYSDRSGVVLPPTPIDDADEILDAIDELRPGGSTNLQAGLEVGYELAAEAFRDDGINRVVLASDGIANVGLTDPDGLSAMIRDSADRGINLVTLGYGMQGFNDVTMEQIANQGDGFYAYIDSDDEAERLFEEELTATLVTVAKDAKIQVEFDEEVVDEYRLIGYENRGVSDSDFRNDEVDAGEIGAGHEATAIYELRLRDGAQGDAGEVFLRWEDPVTGEVTEIDQGIDLDDIATRWNDTTQSLRLATIVTGFAELLRYNEFATEFDFDDLEDAADELLDEWVGDDDQLEELVDLLDAADDLKG